MYSFLVLFVKNIKIGFERLYIRFWFGVRFFDFIFWFFWVRVGNIGYFIMGLCGLDFK